MTDTLEHAAGPLPARSTGKIDLTWGLVNIPLSVYSGLDDGLKVSRKTFNKAGHEVGTRPYDKQTGDNLTNDDKVMKAVTSAGEFVELTDDEMAAATAGRIKGQADIVTFIPLDSIGTVYRIGDECQVRPRKLEVGKKKIDNPAAIKSFTLLRRLMAERGVAALFTLALKTTARYAAILPDGRMVWLAYCEQVREALPLPEIEPSEKETALAQTFMDQIGVDTPTLVDTTAKAIQAFVDAKAAGEPVAAQEEAPDTAPVVDLTDLLAASLAATRSRVEAAEAARTLTAGELAAIDFNAA